MAYRYKMNPNWKAAWVKALRSEDYEQGRMGEMRSEDPNGKTQGFCCLGVLQDLIDKSAFEDRRYESFPSPACLKVTGLPKYRRHETDGSPSPAANGIIAKLAEMNDGNNPAYEGRATFDEIADFIERELQA